MQLAVTIPDFRGQQPLLGGQQRRNMAGISVTGAGWATSNSDHSLDKTRVVSVSHEKQTKYGKQWNLYTYVYLTMYFIDPWWYITKPLISRNHQQTSIMRWQWNENPLMRLALYRGATSPKTTTNTKQVFPAKPFFSDPPNQSGMSF